MCCADCGVWLDSSDFNGHDITGASNHVADRDACKALCEGTAGCNAVAFYQANLFCSVKNFPEGETVQATSSSVGDAMLFCATTENTLEAPKHADIPDCGVWHEESGLAGDVIPGASMHVDDRDACKELCFSTPGCNAVTFNQEKQWCWIQNIQDAADVGDTLAGDTLHICIDASSSDAGLQLLGPIYCAAPDSSRSHSKLA